jgi:putative tryptophan/tyrosine transport system substrate-binding protein
MKLSRRQVVQGAGAVGLGLVAGCGRWLGQVQPSAPRIYRIGWLGPGGRTDVLPTLREAFGELGYVEGQTLIIERRDTDGQAARAQEYAAELVALPVDVILTSGAGSAEAARAATGTTPIVMVYTGDPVAAGLVANLARPGGNVTGVTDVSLQLAPKRLELLKEAVPNIARVAVPQNPDTPSALLQPGGSLQVAAQALGLQLTVLDLRGPSDLDVALQAAIWAGADAVLWGGTTSEGAGFRGPEFRSRLVARAGQYHLPTMSGFLEWAPAGVLMAYATNAPAQYRRAAYYVDRILKGANPDDLPVEQPMRFDFIINLRTAQALGLTIPHHVLLQATEVIQ